MKNEVLKIITEKITSKGYIDLEQFLEISLYDRKFGFYNKLDNFNNELLGSKGHFVTSPEISQMFGELLGVWIIDFCYKSGYKSINLVELGPGNGTLINDVLRVINNHKSEKIRLNLYFLETSGALSKIQFQKIKNFDYSKFWCKKFSKLKQKIIKLPTIFIANEFFDCMPIQQFKSKTPCSWAKVCLKLQNNKLYLNDIPLNQSEQLLINKINLNNTLNKKFPKLIEYSAMSSKIVAQISKIIKKFDGCALFIDYGKDNPFGNTIQSVYKNKKSHLLDRIGESDYSSLVDFSNIRAVARDHCLFTYPLITQRDFLTKLGIKFRAESLSKTASPYQRRVILSSLDRLISKKHMGEVFKVFCISKNKYNLLGFEN